MKYKGLFFVTAASVILSAVMFFCSQTVSPYFGGGVPAAPTGDYLSYAIIASLIALVGVSVLLAIKRKKR